MLKKVITGISLFCLSVLPVFAEPTPTPEAEETEQPESSEVLDIAAGYAVLLDLDSGKVLFEKNSDVETDPASLTKIMTVYLGLEKLPSDRQLTMSDTAFQSYDHNQGVLWIQQGETLSLADCAYASILASANDTTAMLAEETAGSLEQFVELMNQTAGEMELAHTHFDNVFGLASSENYSSAYDLAELTRRALKNSKFRDIFAAPSYSMNPTNRQAQARVIAADCELIRSGTYSFADATGGKIGSTASGGFALAASAKRGATSLVAVVLGEETADAAYRDAVRIFEYGFENAQTVTITPADYGSRTVEVKSGSKHVADVVFTSDSTFSILMPKELDPSELHAEIVVYHEDSSDPEEITAEVLFTLNGETIGSAPMDRTIQMEPVKEAKKPGKHVLSLLDWASLAALAVVVLLPAIVSFFQHLEPPK